MDLSHILSRTERGTQELQTRSGHLTHRQRAMLLLVNGDRTAAEILAHLHSAEPDIDDLARLLADGYVVGRASTKAVPKPAPAPAPALAPQAPAWARLLADGYAMGVAPVKEAPKSAQTPATQVAARHVRQASIADWRLSQAGAFSALQRYIAEGPEAPIDFLNGLAAPLYAALSTCRSEASAHAVVAFLEARLDAAGWNVNDAS